MQCGLGVDETDPNFIMGVYIHCRYLLDCIYVILTKI